MRLTVFGATGRTGTPLVRQALGRGHLVTAVARDPSRVRARHPSLRVVAIPDLGDADATRRALDGADAVLSAIGPRRRNDVPVAAPATHAILTALATASTRRIVVVSAGPVGSPPEDDSMLNRRILTPLVGAFFRPVYEDLKDMERELAASGTGWTVFRPVKLTNGRLTARYRTVLGGAVPAGYTISRADLAHAMLTSLTAPGAEQAVIGIAY